MKVLLSTALHTSAALLLAVAISAQEMSPELRDRQAMTTVAQLLEEDHLTEQQLDNSISRKALDTYIDTLDPLKYYFEKSDISEFKTRQDDLDDMLREGDTEFARHVFRRYLERVDQRMEAVEE